VPILREDAYFYLVPYAPGLEASQPVFSWPEDDMPSPAFSSVESMLNTLYAWYDEGALTADADGRVDKGADHRRYLEVAARENPGTTSWVELLALYPRRH